MTEQIFKGRCFCGFVRFEVTGPVENPCFCHCTSCRLASGAPYLSWGSFLKSSLSVVEGEVTIHRSSEPVERGFCGKCGTTISYFHADRPDYIDITLVSLDESSGIRPKFHIWIANKDPAVIIGDDLPRYDEWRTG
jgi:hypothetical protein